MAASSPAQGRDANQTFPAAVIPFSALFGVRGIPKARGTHPQSSALVPVNTGSRHPKTVPRGWGMIIPEASLPFHFWGSTGEKMVSKSQFVLELRLAFAFIYKIEI